MSQVSAFGKTHSHNGIAGFEQCKVYGKICLRSAVRLNVCVFRAKEHFGSVARDVFNYVNASASAVVTLSGKAFGVFVCEYRSHCRHYRLRNEIFGCYKLDSAALSVKLGFHSRAYLRIKFFYEFNIFFCHVAPPYDLYNTIKNNHIISSGIYQ